MLEKHRAAQFGFVTRLVCKYNAIIELLWNQALSKEEKFVGTTAIFVGNKYLSKLRDIRSDALSQVDAFDTFAAIVSITSLSSSTSNMPEIELLTFGSSSKLGYELGVSIDLAIIAIVLNFSLFDNQIRMEWRRHHSSHSIIWIELHQFLVIVWRSLSEVEPAQNSTKASSIQDRTFEKLAAVEPSKSFELELIQNEPSCTDADTCIQPVNVSHHHQSEQHWMSHLIVMDSQVDSHELASPEVKLDVSIDVTIASPRKYFAVDSQVDQLKLDVSTDVNLASPQMSLIAIDSQVDQLVLTSQEVKILDLMTEVNLASSQMTSSTSPQMLLSQSVPTNGIFFKDGRKQSFAITH